MRMTPAQARAISRGAKTQLRVPVDTRLTATPLRPARRHAGRPFNPTTGDILTIHGGHPDPDNPRRWITTDRTHCKIVAAIRAPLGTVSSQEAEAEGYPTVDEFEIAWVERHDREWLNRQIAYLLEAGTDPEEAEETRPGWAKVRYKTRWTAKDTWHLTIEPFHDMPVLLGSGREQYVEAASQAIQAVDENGPEPEAVPPANIHSRWNIKSQRRYQEACDQELRHRDAKQLARRVKLMKLNQPDAPEIAVIEEQLRQLEMRLAQAA